MTRAAPVSNLPHIVPQGDRAQSRIIATRLKALSANHRTAAGLLDPPPLDARAPTQRSSRTWTLNFDGIAICELPGLALELADGLRMRGSIFIWFGDRPIVGDRWRKLVELRWSLVNAGLAPIVDEWKAESAWLIAVKLEDWRRLLLRDFSDEVFTSSLYSDILGRTADEEGASFYRAELNAGLSRVEALRIFLLSPERRARRLLVDPTPSMVADDPPMRFALLDLASGADDDAGCERQESLVTEETANANGG